MKLTRLFDHATRYLAVPALLLAVAPLAAQEAVPVARLVAEPGTLTMVAGTTAPLAIRALDANGRTIANAELRVFGGRRTVAWADGQVQAFVAGSHVLTATAAGAGGVPVMLEIPVTVTWPALATLEIISARGNLYTGVTLAHSVRGAHADGSGRPGLEPVWRSSDDRIATVDRFGNVRGLRPGAVTITAVVEGTTARQAHTVVANPVASLELDLGDPALRTGDVLPLKATARRADGSVVPDAPITWSYTFTPEEANASAGVQGGAGIIQFDRFAGNYPGRYTLMARSGNTFAEVTLGVTQRDVRRKIAVTSRGNITNTHTSDLWPWTGKDGRDYALVGTWGADGYALVFDITDMNNIVKTDSVRVDARTINDVTVSPDGRYGVLSREGASNRVNGVVILDLANPAHPKVASTFDQELTGGVHNMFATNDHLFAVSGGAKYVIIDVKDIYNPKYVSEYRHPNARIHDLWVRDGIAYSAQGGAGTVVVDVGNGKYGGTIENPKLITVYEVNSGHEIYPYYQQASGRTYLFIGDEEMNRAGRVWEGTNYRGEMTTPGGVPQTSGGFVHIVDFTDPMHPLPVGRYHLEDFGAHDIIVEDDVMYHAYYEGGVRLVDVSGELLGNLADQNREIAVFKPFDPQGFTPNASFVMNAMPWKGHVLFSDFNSGLWAARLQPKTTLTP